MLKNIPTHVIAGPLGAGKTSLIRHLLAQRPAHERWAVLINEFGLIGLDAALLTTDDDGIALGEVAGGFGAGSPGQAQPRMGELVLHSSRDAVPAWLGVSLP